VLGIDGDVDGLTDIGADLVQGGEDAQDIGGRGRGFDGGRGGGRRCDSPRRGYGGGRRLIHFEIAFGGEIEGGASGMQIA